MIELITAAVLFVVLACAAAGIADAQEQRRLDDEAQREGSRRRHPSYVKKLRRPYDWSKDDG